MAAQLFPEANTETAFTKLPYKTEKGKKRGAGDLRFEFTLPVTLRRCSVRRTTQTALFGSNLLCNRHLARSKLQSISHPDTMYSNIHYIHAYTPVINLISLRFNLPFQFYVQLDAPASSFKAPAACSFGTVCKIYEHFVKDGNPDCQILTHCCCQTEALFHYFMNEISRAFAEIIAQFKKT